MLNDVASIEVLNSFGELPQHCTTKLYPEMLNHVGFA